MEQRQLIAIEGLGNGAQCRRLDDRVWVVTGQGDERGDRGLGIAVG